MQTAVSAFHPFPRLASLAAVSLLAGCGEELLTLNYVVMPTSPQFVAQVASGQRSVTDAFGSAPCILTVNTDVTGITSHKNGDLGQAGYNIAISTVSPSNAVTSNPASCPDIESLAMNIGRQGEVLDVGSTTNSTNLDATVGGVGFASSSGGYFAAQISGQNQTEGTVSGTFEAISTDGRSVDSVMIVTQGSFKVK